MLYAALVMSDDLRQKILKKRGLDMHVVWLLKEYREYGLTCENKFLESGLHSWFSYTYKKLWFEKIEHVLTDSEIPQQINV